MKSPIPQVFANKDWGTETVFEETLEDLKDYTLYRLDTLNDIDYASDLKPYPEFVHYLS
jgi:glycosyltransferase A (GT-A) superfamily protein (DUF2064 family)